MTRSLSGKTLFIGSIYLQILTGRRLVALPASHVSLPHQPSSNMPNPRLVRLKSPPLIRSSLKIPPVD